MMFKKWLKGASIPASVIALAGLASFTALPAQAGFEWTPPAAKTAAPPVIAAPAPAVEAEPLVPEISPFPLEQVEQTSVQPSAMPAPVSAPGKTFEEVVGFGSDIPLALAMNQIVPAHYSYSFDPSVNPGTRVSWNGGKPWDEVLAEAVRPLGLSVVISGNSVWLREKAEETQPGLAAMSAPVPVMAEPEPFVPAPVQETQPPAAPLPLAAYEPEPEEQEQSYPRRQRPAMEIPQDQSAAAAPQDMEQSPSMPIPLMKALPQPPEAGAPATPALMASPSEPPLLTPPPATIAAPVMESGGKGPVMDPFEIRFWQADQGASLKDVLGQWAGMANVAMLWDSPNDYILPAPVSLHGTFPDAVTQVLMTYSAADPRPLGRLHPNLPQGPSVLVIENFSQATN